MRYLQFLHSIDLTAQDNQCKKHNFKFCVRKCFQSKTEERDSIGSIRGKIQLMIAFPKNELKNYTDTQFLPLNFCGIHFSFYQIDLLIIASSFFSSLSLLPLINVEPFLLLILFSVKLIDQICYISFCSSDRYLYIEILFLGSRDQRMDWNFEQWADFSLVWIFPLNFEDLKITWAFLLRLLHATTHAL